MSHMSQQSSAHVWCQLHHSLTGLHNERSSVREHAEQRVSERESHFLFTLLSGLPQFRNLLRTVSGRNWLHACIIWRRCWGLETGRLGVVVAGFWVATTRPEQNQPGFPEPPPFVLTPSVPPQASLWLLCMYVCVCLCVCVRRLVPKPCSRVAGQGAHAHGRLGKNTHTMVQPAGIWDMSLLEIVLGVYACVYVVIWLGRPADAVWLSAVASLLCLCLSSVPPQTHCACHAALCLQASYWREQAGASQPAGSVC